MDNVTKESTREQLLATLSSLSHLFTDESIQEIMVNGENDVWIDSFGKKTKLDIEISANKIIAAIKILARLNGKDAKEGTADSIIDARLKGMRVAAALPPIAVNGPMMSFRIHSKRVFRLDDYVASGSIDEEMKTLLKKIVRTRKNVIVAGGTSSGKTTFLNAMLAEVDNDDRIFTIEDTQELQILPPNWVPMEANAQAGVTMRLLLRLALRSRPDRIIMGEVRGAEAYDLMQAANTGHDGAFCTLHANSAFSALSRLENLILTSGENWPHHAVCSAIAETFNYVIFMSRREDTGVRYIKELIQLNGYDKGKGEYAYTHLIARP